MAPSLPLPVRVVVGLVATGWDTVRNLPTELPALSVSIAGHVVRVSMRVQQEITELAARGDELLSVVTSRPSEHPTWAHFDEEDGDAAVGGPSSTADGSAGAADTDRPAAQRSAFDEVELDIDVAWVAVGDEAFNDDAETLIDVEEMSVVLLVEPDDVLADADVDPDAVESERPDDASDADAAGPVVASDAGTASPPRLHVVPDAPAGHDSPETPATPEPPASDALSDPAPIRPAVAAPASGRAGPAALPGYDRMTLAQVRGRLRGLSPGNVAELLSYEQAGAGRAPFLTLLSNRIATLEHEAP